MLGDPNLEERNLNILPPFSPPLEDLDDLNTFAISK